VQHDWPDSVMPDDIASEYRSRRLLERDGLDHIEVGARRPRGRQRTSGVDHAIFDYGDGTEFGLMVFKKRTGDLLALLRETYPGLVKDHRNLG